MVAEAPPGPMTNDTRCGINFSEGRWPLVFIYSVVFTLALVAHLLTLCPIIQQVRSHNILGVYLLNLSLSDLLYTLTVPLWIHYYYNNHTWHLGRHVCHIAGFIYYSNTYISIFMLCCISLDRCLAVSFPLWAKAFRKPKYGWYISAFVILGVMGVHLPVALVNSNNNTLLNGSSEMKDCYDSYPLSTLVAKFNYIRITFGFLVPLALLIFCNFQVFRGVRKSSSIQDKSKRKVKLLSIWVIVIFAFCFAPYHIILFLRTIVSSLHPGSCDFDRHVHHLFSFSLAMSSLNSVADPFLYVFSSNCVREDLSGISRSLCAHLGHRWPPHSSSKLSIRQLSTRVVTSWTALDKI
ncbi:G protein-coupled receptor 184 [Polypterus senegalus]